MSIIQQAQYNSERWRKLTLTIDDHPRKLDGFYRCGPAAAVWTIIDYNTVNRTLTLQPADPHLVPLDEPCPELPLPINVPTHLRP